MPTSRWELPHRWLCREVWRCLLVCSDPAPIGFVRCLPSSRVSRCGYRVSRRESSRVIFFRGCRSRWARCFPSRSPKPPTEPPEVLLSLPPPSAPSDTAPTSAGSRWWYFWQTASDCSRHSSLSRAVAALHFWPRRCRGAVPTCIELEDQHHR